MTRPLVLLGGLLALLIGADVALSASEATTRRERNRVRRLVPPAERDVSLVRAIRLEPFGRPPIVYAHDGALWRCRSFRDAVCDGSHVERLLRDLFDGVGLAPRDATPATARGFDGAGMVTVSLSPDGRTWTSFDVGRSLEGGRGSWVRHGREREVVAYDVDLREVVAGAGTARIPPLVDRTLVTAAWLAKAQGLKSVRVASRGATPFTIERRRSTATTEAVRAGTSPWAWFLLREGEAEAPAEAARCESYVSFLEKAPWADVADARSDPLEEFRDPRALVTLAPAEGEPLSLAVSARELGKPPRTAAPVHNPFVGARYAVATPLLALLVPSADAFRAGTKDDPWAPTPPSPTGPSAPAPEADPAMDK